MQRRPRPIAIIDPVQGGKAGSKDPRTAVRGNEPYAQPDIQQIDYIRDNLEANLVPQYNDRAGGGKPEYRVETSPTSLQAIPWVINTVVGFVPQLWVPRNPARKGLILGNENAASIHFTIGNPPLIGAASTPIGYLLTNATVPVQFFPAPTDDIFVFANSVLPVIAYELFELPAGAA